MKKLKFFFLIISIFLLSNILKAQKFKGGIITGLAATQVQGDVCSGYDKVGLNFGCFVNLPVFIKNVSKKDSIVIYEKKKNNDTIFFDHWEIQMELKYLQKGSRMNPKESNDLHSYKLKLNYVELPIIIKYVLTKKWTFEAGLSYGYLINHSEEYDDVASAGKPFKKHALNGILGAYYAINKKLKVNFRFNDSLIPIREHASGAKRFFNRGQYSDAICLSLHYQFR
ncbi:MAG: PorT family protein [Bacteroidales bacterium]|nr:PorT family protein [Bacteroidales bacterium]